MDEGTPVTDYGRTDKFTGKIDHVTIEIFPEEKVQ
jgi:hypothetical protein